MESSIEFNYIMQKLNKIHVGGAKAQGVGVVSFAASLSAVFYALTVTVENNFQYVIFSQYFLIMAIIAIVLTWIRVKVINLGFSETMKGVKDLKRGQKRE